MRQRGRPRVRRLRRLVRRAAGRAASSPPTSRASRTGGPCVLAADRGGRGRRADRVHQGRAHRRGSVDGEEPHRPPHGRRRRRVGGVPPVRHHPGRRPRRAAGHRRHARPGRSPPPTDGVCVYAISGGTGAHMADLAAAAGLRLPDLTPESQAALHEWIPTYLRVSNPVDNGGPPSSDWRGREDPRHDPRRPERRLRRRADHRRRSSRCRCRSPATSSPWPRRPTSRSA